MLNHFSVSLFKSFLRIAGCVTALYTPNRTDVFALCFLIAEILGIVEEIVDKRKEE